MNCTLYQPLAVDRLFQAMNLTANDNWIALFFMMKKRR